MADDAELPKGTLVQLEGKPEPYEIVGQTEENGEISYLCAKGTEAVLLKRNEFTVVT